MQQRGVCDSLIIHEQCRQGHLPELCGAVRLRMVTGISSRKEECHKLRVRQVARNGEHSDELTVSIGQSRSVRGGCLHQRHPTRPPGERAEGS